jgi:hypothetical protein
MTDNNTPARTTLFDNCPFEVLQYGEESRSDDEPIVAHLRTPQQVAAYLRACDIDFTDVRVHGRAQIFAGLWLAHYEALKPWLRGETQPEQHGSDGADGDAGVEVTSAFAAGQRVAA